MSTAHGAGALTSLKADERQKLNVRSSSPLTLAKDKADFYGDLSVQRGKGRASTLYIQRELYRGALLDNKSTVPIKI